MEPTSRERESLQLALGELLTEHLRKHQVATFFINALGEVEWAPHWETRLDHLPPEAFIQELIQLGYQDEHLERALKAREHRLGIVYR